MQVTTAALKQTPPIRADRVTALTARITDGTYQVPGADIAARMLADEADVVFSARPRTTAQKE